MLDYFPSSFYGLDIWEVVENFKSKIIHSNKLAIYYFYLFTIASDSPKTSMHLRHKFDKIITTVFELSSCRDFLFGQKCGFCVDEYGSEHICMMFSCEGLRTSSNNTVTS